MRNYSTKISLVTNSRGVTILDTTMGCASGMSNTKGGCYGDCYAAKSAKTYGYDFTKTVLRDFINRSHKAEIIKAISNIKLQFVRIGGSGDPSENWEHTLKILKAIANCNKEIVIITRHWKCLTDEQLDTVSKWNVCINTSVSALDKPFDLNNSIREYNRLKPYCKSILRVVTCNFNKENIIGRSLSKVQEDLMKNDSVIDTVFRPSKNNPFVLSGIVNAKNEIFNGNKQLASKHNRKTYMGKCDRCIEMCGVNVTSDYSGKRNITKQSELWEH